MVRIREHVDADVAALVGIPGALALPSRARGAGCARVPAGAAVRRMGVGVHALSGAQRLPAGASAHAACAKPPRRARVVAGAAVFGVVERIDADSRAVEETRRTLAGCVEARLGRPALVPTAAAVVRVELEADAFPWNALAEASKTAIATLVELAHLVAAVVSAGAAMVAVVEQVDALAVAECFAGRAGTSP
jgi:hypothetical protein